MWEHDIPHTCTQAQCAKWRWWRLGPFARNRLGNHRAVAENRIGWGWRTLSSSSNDRLHFGFGIGQWPPRTTSLRTWIHYTTLKREDLGATSFRLKRNPAPSRTGLDPDLIPDAVVESDRDSGSVHSSRRVEVRFKLGAGTDMPAGRPPVHPRSQSHLAR